MSRPKWFSPDNEMSPLIVVGGGGPIMGDLWALKGLIEEG